jgi:hypothetical protein
MAVRCGAAMQCNVLHCVDFFLESWISMTDGGIGGDGGGAGLAGG